MKNGIMFLSILLVVLSVTIGCTSPIDIKTENSDERLVVFGAFSQDTLRNYISISRSMGYFSQQPPVPIEQAEVTITADGVVHNMLSDTVKGRFYIDSLDMVVGRKYVLDIYLDFDKNGVKEHYRATSTMTNSPRIDSVHLSKIVIDKIPIMMVYGEVFYTSDNNFCIYGWKNSETLKLIDYIMIMPESFIISTGSVYPVPYFIRDGFSKGDTLHLRIDNLNDYYAQFLSQVSSESNMNNPWFSSPPAEVRSNVVCVDADIAVSGFFTTFSCGKVFSVVSDIDFSLTNR